MIKVSGNSFHIPMQAGNGFLSRKTIVAAILAVALIAFEIFNFDTTQFALSNLLGDVRFAGIMWASILAIAFCAIDFAGLVRLFTPQRGQEEPRAVWFLIGAWFLGTIANAVMTWWAVSLTLLSHEFGNEVLGREALLRYVPVFVAMLVWLTRILFIGAFSLAGEDVLGMVREDKDGSQSGTKTQSAALPPRPVTAPSSARPPATVQAKPAPARNAPPIKPAPTYEPLDEPQVVPNGAPSTASGPKTSGTAMPSRPQSRIRQRPPMPGAATRPTPSGLQAQPKNKA
ncbi:MAG: hypothetical protein R6X18_07575 [Chloroflexota bacterium]